MGCGPEGPDLLEDIVAILGGRRNAWVWSGGKGMGLVWKGRWVSEKESIS